MFINTTFAATYNANVSGDWMNNSNWTTGNYPGKIPNNKTYLEISNNDIINIQANTNIILDKDLVLKNNLTIVIFAGASLTIKGYLEANNNLTIDVKDGGIFIIEGDFESKNGSELSIAGTASVTGNFTLGENSGMTIDGNLSVTGTFTAPEGTILSGDGFFTHAGGAEALPIELKYFEGEVVNNEVLFSWATATELNNELFVIEHSTDTETWNEVYSTYGAGNSIETINYEATVNVETTTSTNYFRLKQIDYDGAFTYSSIITVNAEINNSSEVEVRTYPNPVTDNITISSSNAEIVSVKIYNSNNVVVNTAATGNNVSIAFTDFQEGIYFMEVVLEGNIKTTHSIIK